MSKRKSECQPEVGTNERVVIDAGDGIDAEELSEAGRVLQAGITDPQGEIHDTPLPDPAPEMEGDKPYTMGAWNGLPQWKCRLCPWDTLNGEAAMLEHIATRHKPPAPKLSVLVADKYGRPK